MCAHRPVLLPFLRPGRTLLHVLTSWNGRDIVRADGERRASVVFLGVMIFSERGTHRAGEARGEELGVRRELRHVRDIPSERDPGKVMLQNLHETCRGLVERPGADNWRFSRGVARGVMDSPGSSKGRSRPA